jgi:hypothetical protein
MKTLQAFKKLSYAEKFKLVESVFAALSKYYDYFKELYQYMQEHKSSINEEFLETSYGIAYKLHEKLEK